MWVKRSDYEKLKDELSTAKVKIYNLERNSKAWSDADLSLDLIEHIARVNHLHFVGSVDNSFFLLQRNGEEKIAGDGIVW